LECILDKLYHGYIEGVKKALDDLIRTGGRPDDIANLQEMLERLIKDHPGMYVVGRRP
jgi:hypothetical protein